VTARARQTLKCAASVCLRVAKSPFAMPVAVRFRDIDGMGHVNNAVYFTYVEHARTDYLMGVMGARRMDEVDWIVATASLAFKRPVAYGDPIEVRVRPSKVGRTSFTLAYEIVDTRDQGLVAEGETVIVMYDYGRRAKKEIPPAVRKRLEADAAL
jgi:acyl-CoA thioester hydrolase